MLECDFLGGTSRHAAASAARPCVASFSAGPVAAFDARVDQTRASKRRREVLSFHRPVEEQDLIGQPHLQLTDIPIDVPQTADKPCKDSHRRGRVSPSSSEVILISRARLKCHCVTVLDAHSHQIETDHETTARTAADLSLTFA